VSGGTGVLLVDKPAGITSHDVVSRVRRALGTRRVGHAGTLDPMATGLLLVGVGSSTRLLTYLLGLGKEYEATIRLGAATTTDDAEGEVVSEADAAGLDPARIREQVAALTGAISQVPSTVSAIKVAGRRAYDLARAGEAVELAARDVVVSRFDVRATRANGSFRDLDVVVEVSSGTYVRALARDLGAALGVGGHLTALRRTRIGPFDVADAVALDEVGPAALRVPADVATALYPALPLDAGRLADLANGKRLAVDAPDAPVAAALGPDGRLAGLVAVAGGRTRVLVNFPVEEVLA